MRAMRTFLLVCLTVAACSGGHKPVAKTPPPPADPIPVTGGPDCKTVADHLVTVVLADKLDQQAAAAPALRSRCTDDKWPDTARSCFNTATDQGELDGCLKMLSQAQRDAFDKASQPTGVGGAQVMAPAAPGGGPADTKADKPKSTPKGGTRGPAKKDTGGPKTESDPCQGGQ
jgi:hypothetical protein